MANTSPVTEQNRDTDARRFAIVTGASSGIGYELAKCCAQDGFDLLVAADEPIEAAAEDFRALGAQVDAIEADLATKEGVDRLYKASRGRRLTRCSPTPATASARVFSTRTPTTCGT